jgi:hypothetical protein
VDPKDRPAPIFWWRENYYINELGIAMIYPNVRGSTGYGKSFQKLDNGLLREGSYKDINSLFDWIRDNSPISDASRNHDHRRQLRRIHDAGCGNPTTTTRICLLVDIVARQTWSHSWSTPRGIGATCGERNTANERDPKMHEFLEQIAPANKAKNITKPLFVHCRRE